MGRVRARRGRGGMVGALADWFAVTALFRHPLGIPIPHTAIIPTRKDALGDRLGDVRAARTSSPRRSCATRCAAWSVGSGSGWIAARKTPSGSPRRWPTVVRGPGPVLRDEDVQAVIEQAWSAVRRQAVGPPLGKVLRQGAHRRRAPPAGGPRLRPRVRLGARTTTRRCCGSSTSGRRLVAAVRRRHRRRQGVRRGAELRVGGEDQPEAPDAQGGRHVPRRVRRRPAARPRRRSSGPSGSSTRWWRTRMCSSSSGRPGAR